MKATLAGLILEIFLSLVPTIKENSTVQVEETECAISNMDSYCENLEQTLLEYNTYHCTAWGSGDDYELIITVTSKGEDTTEYYIDNTGHATSDQCTVDLSKSDYERIRSIYDAAQEREEEEAKVRQDITNIDSFLSNLKDTLENNYSCGMTYMREEDYLNDLILDVKPSEDSGVFDKKYVNCEGITTDDKVHLSCSENDYYRIRQLVYPISVNGDFDSDEVQALDKQSIEVDDFESFVDNVAYGVDNNRSVDGGAIAFANDYYYFFIFEILDEAGDNVMFVDATGKPVSEESIVIKLPLKESYIIDDILFIGHDAYYFD